MGSVQRRGLAPLNSTKLAQVATIFTYHFSLLWKFDDRFVGGFSNDDISQLSRRFEFDLNIETASNCTAPRVLNIQPETTDRAQKGVLLVLLQLQQRTERWSSELGVQIPQLFIHRAPGNRHV